MTAKQLQHQGARYKQATDRADACRADLYAAIRAALAEGMTQRKIAEATGLTHGRIAQIALKDG